MPETAVKFWGDCAAPQASAPYPERRAERDNWVDRFGARLLGSAAALLRPRRLQDHRFVRDVIARTARLEGLSRAETAERARRLRAAMLREGFTDAYLAEAFALTRRACQTHLGLAQRPVQIFAARRLIRGAMIEMATGEGKTVTAALAAAAAAMAGGPVHVITVNGYLAERDCTQLRPVYEALGLRCAFVVQGMDDAARRAAYAADIVHAECKELCFDYLRDRLSVGERRGAGRVVIGRFAGAAAGAPLMLRGLHFAIIDEADSVLIDEAKTPLIISAEAPLPPEEAQRLGEALAISETLQKGRDYAVLADQREIRLTTAGRDAARQASRGLGSLWTVARAREEAVTQALSARHLFRRDRHYMVKDGTVQIVDEFTGRAMPDRSWEAGLHQLIELKEGLAPTGTKVPVARITFQRFFSRYRRLSGMTGTGMECAGEVWAGFSLRTTPVPTHATLRRTALPPRLFRTQPDRWRAVVTRAAALAGAGRAVLIGTRSVAASETVSALLRETGLPHVVLNAQQDADEAAIVAAAGRAGTVTVATNMAGRGTDIALDGAVRAAGGLHVILTEFHESARIDRQLIGRCGRQGDPGSWEAVVALDDEVFTRFVPVMTRLLTPLARGPGARPVLALLRRAAQARAERQGRSIRMAQLLAEREQERRLAFTGAPL
jgi:preprotein translocase subunit SecA